MVRLLFVDQFNKGFQMRSKYFLLRHFKFFREYAELAQNLLTGITVVKSFIFVPCFFYFFLFTITGNCFGFNNSFFLSSKERVHNQDVVMLPMFDVKDSVSKRHKDIFCFIPFANELFTTSGNYSSKHKNKNSPCDFQKVQVAGTKSNSAYFHYILHPFVLSVIAGVWIIISGTRR